MTSISTRQTFSTFRPATLADHPHSRLREGYSPASCFQKGCGLHLVMFIKMAAVSYLNVNYCCDTQGSLTCFGNLFILLIRCSYWKIFQSVTTVPKVKWQEEGAFPQDRSCKPGLGVPLPVTWMNNARDQRWSFWNQAGGTRHLQELDDSRGR